MPKMGPRRANHFETRAFFASWRRAIERLFIRGVSRAGARRSNRQWGHTDMRTIAASSGRGRLAMLAAAGILALGLTACSSDDDTTSGSPFTQALQKDYSDLSGQASALPAESGSEPSFWDTLNPFSSS